MMIKLALYGVVIFHTAMFLTGCANVDRWDRHILAKESMTTMPDPLRAEFMAHTYYSREGTQGATGTSGGGCGCN